VKQFGKIIGRPPQQGGNFDQYKSGGLPTFLGNNVSQDAESLLNSSGSFCKLIFILAALNYQNFAAARRSDAA
jgi:hypothetical protein